MLKNQEINKIKRKTFNNIIKQINLLVFFLFFKNYLFAK